MAGELVYISDGGILVTDGGVRQCCCGCDPCTGERLTWIECPDTRYSTKLSLQVLGNQCAYCFNPIHASTTENGASITWTETKVDPTGCEAGTYVATVVLSGTTLTVTVSRNGTNFFSATGNVGECVVPDFPATSPLSNQIGAGYAVLTGCANYVQASCCCCGANHQFPEKISLTISGFPDAPIVFPDYPPVPNPPNVTQELLYDQVNGCRWAYYSRGPGWGNEYEWWYNLAVSIQNAVGGGCALHVSVASWITMNRKFTCTSWGNPVQTSVCERYLMAYPGYSVHKLSEEETTKVCEGGTITWTPEVQLQGQQYGYAGADGGPCDFTMQIQTNGDNGVKSFSVTF